MTLNSPLCNTESKEEEQFMKLQIIHTIITLFCITHFAYGMDTKTPKEYSSTIANADKALIVIQALILKEGRYHIKIKPTLNPNVKIKALVAAKDVESQEKQYTESQFLPFFLDQTPQEITIKPHVPGVYTVRVPQNTRFKTLESKATIEVDPSLAAFNTTDK